MNDIQNLFTEPKQALQDIRTKLLAGVPLTQVEEEYLEKLDVFFNTRKPPVVECARSQFDFSFEVSVGDKAAKVELHANRESIKVFNWDSMGFYDHSKAR